MNGKRNIRLKCILFSFAFACVLILIQSFNPLYAQIDTFWISVITNGVFDKENYCSHISAALCSLIKGIDRVFPYADGYALFIRSVFFCIYWWYSYYILTYRKKAYWGVLLFLALFFPSNTNFTVTSSLFSSAGFLGVLLALKNGKPLQLIPGCIFVLAGFLNRFYGALLAVPFFACTAVCYAVSLGERNPRKILSLLPLLFAILAIYETNCVARNSEQYAESIRYNAARSGIVDYPRKDWEEMDTEDLDFSENDYELAANLFLADTDIMDADFLERIAEACADDSATSLVQAVKSAVTVPFTSGSRKAMLILALNLLLVLDLILARRDYWRKLGAGLLFFGYLFAGTVLAYRGRYLAHVCLAMLIPLLLSLVFLRSARELQTEAGVPEELQGKWKSVRRAVRACIIAALLLLPCIGLIGTFAESTGTLQFAVNARNPLDDSFYQRDEDDTVYVWECFTFNWINVYNGYMVEGKLPTEEFLTYNVIAGEWVSGQAYMNNYLHRIGMDNPVRSMLERDDVRYVSEEIAGVETFVSEHYSGKYRTVQVGTLCDVPVWKFENSD